MGEFPIKVIFELDSEDYTSQKKVLINKTKNSNCLEKLVETIHSLVKKTP